MKATILITTYNRAELLRYGLSSLLPYLTSDTEVIVLDEGSDTETKEFVLGLENENIHYLKTRTDNSTEWRVPGFAFNIGIQRAKGKYIFLSCAEMYHTQNTLARSLELLEAQPNVLVFPKLHDDPGVVLDRLRSGQEVKDLSDIPVMTNYFLPFFMGVSTCILKAINGYDEDFVGLAYDDNDIISRLQFYGCTMQFLDSPVVHLYHLRFPESTIHTPRFILNRKLYESRYGTIKRNIDREWGNKYCL